MDSTDIIALRELLTPPLGGGCPLPDSELAALLERGGNLSAAAYEGCLRLAESSALKLPDGTATADQSAYWRRLAALYRPNHNRTVGRGDDA